MPFTRTIAAISLIVLLTFAFMGPRDNTWISNESLWVAVLLATVIFLISLMRSFFLDVVVIFAVTFIVQRIVVLYFFPELFDYALSIKLTTDIFNSALWFIIACLLAVCLGYILYRFSTPYNRQVKEEPDLDKIRIGGWEISFSRFFSFYAVFVILTFILRQVLDMYFNVGVTGIQFDRSFSIFFRLAILVNALYFIMFIPLIKKNRVPRDRKLAWLLIMLQLLEGFMTTSKAVLLILLINFIVCYVFIKRRFSRRFVTWGLVILVLSVLVYAPLITVVRSEKITATMTGKSFDISRAIEHLKSNESSKSPVNLLARFGGLDWLLGLMAVGRDKFPYYISVKGDAAMIINSFIPGHPIDTSRWLSLRHVIPILLRGYNPDSISSWGGHGELLGIVGMAYVYFGLWGGALFFLVWTFISLKVISSKLGVMAKILYFQCFVTEIILGGYMVTAFKVFFEGILIFSVIFMLARLTPKFRVKLF